MRTLTLLAFVLLLVQSYMAVDYVVTTKQLFNYDNGVGFISFPATTYGQGEYLTIAFDFAMDTLNSCLLGMGKDENFLDITVRSGHLYIRDANTQAQVLNNPLKVGQYYHLLLEFRNEENRSILKVYISGKEVSLSTNVFKRFSNAQRKESYAGLCKSRNGESPLSTGAIYFDEFFIFDRLLTSEEKKIISNPSLRRPISDRAMIVYYPFNEGVGRFAYGVAGTFAKESFTAELNKLARFTTRIEQGTLKCQSTGDPHITDFNGHYWTPTHRKDWSRLLSCVGNGKEKFFTINSFHDFGHPSHPKATLNRELTVKYGSTIIKISLSLDISVKKKSGVYENYGKYTGQIGDLFFKYNAQNTVLYVYGSPFALLQVNKQGTTHLDVYITASSTLCKGKSYCSGNKDFIHEIEYEGDDENVPIPPPLADPPQTEPYKPCDENPHLTDLAHQVCAGKWLPGTPQYDACVFDVCATGDPTVPDVDEDCLARKRQLIEEGRTDEANQLPCVNNPCNCVFGTCDTETLQCQCYPGYTGPDCSQDLYLLNLTVEHSQVFNGRAVNLNSHQINVNSPSAVSDAPSSMNEWWVEDSLLVYVASVKQSNEGTYKYFLYLVGDMSSQTSNHDVSFTYTTSGTVNKNAVKVLGQGSVNTATNTATVKFDPFYRNGLFFDDLGNDWCVTFDLSNSLFNQGVVGSGNKLAKLDILKVPNGSRNSVKVCGKVLENPCAQYTDCQDCMARSECGWCRSNNRCLLGNPAGPVEGSSCPRWAFTFDDETSRRINAEFGVPVNPKRQDVFLVPSGALSTLPVEITVDMGHSKGSVFDVAIISPKGSAELNLFKQSMVNYLSHFTSYPNVGVAFATYDSSEFKIVQPIGALEPSTAYIPQALNDITPTNSGGSVNNALKSISTNKHPNWRSTTRHVVMIYVGTDNADSASAPSVELLSQSIFPVFIVNTQAKKTHYENYVKSLGFGAVIAIDQAGSGLGIAIRDGLDIAAKAVALVPTQEGYLVEGTYDKSVWNIHGLQLNMRGRMQFPMKKDDDPYEKTILVAPGFGTATIENLLTDKPTPNSEHVDMLQEQPLPENTQFFGEIIELTGRALDPSDPIQIEILGFGAPHKPHLGIGKFYQLPDDFTTFQSIDELAPHEIQYDESFNVVGGGVFINNAAGKIIYIPPTGEDAFSVSNKGKFPFTSIKYRVHDSCVASDVDTVNIYIAYQNKPPVNDFYAPTGLENRALLINLGGIDYRGHELCSVVDRLPYQIIDGVEHQVGRLYVYDQSVFNQLDAVVDIYRDLDLDNVLSQLTPVTVGNEICSNKVIFIPDRYTNSDNIPASGKYQVEPSIDYHVVQVRNDHDAPDDVMLTSNTGHYAFYIQWVNQAPTVNVNEVPVPPGSCTYQETCVFDQNLGVFLPNIPTPEFLSAIAGDIEEEPVQLIVTSVQCNDAILEDIDGTPITNGYTINEFEVYNWYNIFKFRPAIDAHGDNYCTITYKARDNNGLESEEASIVIDINFVNQPPYSNNININAFETANNEPFNLKVFDPDNTVVEGFIVGCEKHMDTTFIFTFNGVTFNTDDCDSLEVSKLSIGSITIPPEVGGVNIPSTISCTENCPSENGFAMKVFISYEDGEEDERGLAPYIYDLNIEYKVMNKPGYFWVGDDEENKSRDYYHIVDEKIPLNDAERFPCGDIDLNISDPDSGIYQTTLELNIIAPENKFVIFDGLGYILPYYVQMDDTFRWVEIKASVAEIRTVLENLKVCTEDELVFNVTYRYNDGGHLGYCPFSDITLCAHESYANLQFTSANLSNIPTIAGTVAAGAVVIGAAAAIGAWLKFKRLRAPLEGSDPWAFDDQNEGVVDNPMYEQRGVESENPLYEANADE